jgi:hypothetical protein
MSREEEEEEEKRSIPRKGEIGPFVRYEFVW